MIRMLRRTFLLAASLPVLAAAQMLVIAGGHGIAVVEEPPAELTSACNDGSTADDIYVRDGGTGNGSAWNNALDSMASTITRGKDVYLADGTYPSYTFDDATSGSTVTNICKATVLQHGTDTGWLDTYGDGQAVFTNELEFNTANWIVDGVTGGGPADWNCTNCGFKIASTIAEPLIRITSTSSDNVWVKHIELAGNSNTSGGGSEAQDGIENNGGDSFHLSYAYSHDIGRCHGFLVSSPNALIEYNHFGSYHFTGPQHSEAFAIYNGDQGSGVTLRWNLMSHITGTGGVMWDNVEDPTDTLWFYGNVIYHAVDDDTWYENETEAPENGVLGGWSGTGAAAEEFHNFKAYHNTIIDWEIAGDALSDFPANSNSGNEARCNYFYNGGNNVGGGSAVWGTVTHNHFNGSTAVGTNTTTSSGDPFVDLAGRNFRLTVDTTACVDLGAPFNTDMYGNTGLTRGAAQYAP